MTRVRQDYGYLQGKTGKGEKGWTEPDGNGRIAVDIEPAEIKTKEGIFMSEAKKTGHFRLTSQEHYSEAFCTSAFLALSGGFQDAYTYNCRDGVFSNAQTGNIVLMSQHLMQGEWGRCLHYFVPVVAFALGVLISEQIQHRYKYAKKMHWRQGILLAEIAILFAVGFIPASFNVAATVLVSLSCAMQVQTFRKVGGYSYASTMCIGNLRGGMEALSVYLREHKKGQLRQASYYFGVIFLFAIGAGIGGVLSVNYGIRVIWVSCVLLLVSFILMALDRFN